MRKKQGSMRRREGSAYTAEQIGLPVAVDMGLEWVEATLHKENGGKHLRIFLDKEGGLTLDDCERYHKNIQPLLEEIDYDFLEVSSPGLDRPIQTIRDFQKNKGKPVELKLYAPVDGQKLYYGVLQAMDDQSVTIELERVGEKIFHRASIAVIKPVIEWSEDDIVNGPDNTL